MNWRGSWGNFIYNNVDSNNGSFQNILLRETDLSNGVANVLETGFASQDAKRYESDYFIQDASFIRLDNVSVGYTFNQKPNSTSLVKLTLAAQNVLLITDYSGLDPEISGGIDNNLYPRPITFTLGLNVNF
jgi:iron complex outermembrane receptor protein